MSTPDHWKKIKEAREKLSPEERRTKALEDIADELVMLRSDVQRIWVEVSKAATKLPGRR